jgi:hypothetical protein
LEVVEAIRVLTNPVETADELFCCSAITETALRNKSELNDMPGT